MSQSQTNEILGRNRYKRKKWKKNNEIEIIRMRDKWKINGNERLASSSVHNPYF